MSTSIFIRTKVGRCTTKGQHRSPTQVAYLKEGRREKNKARKAATLRRHILRNQMKYDAHALREAAWRYQG